MLTISDKVYVHAGGVRVLPNGNYLTSDQDVRLEYRQQLGLEKTH